MEWFGGSVEEALREYQNKNGLCLVYVTQGEKSSNEVSRAFDSLWETFDKNTLAGIPHVAIKLIAGSDGAKQFAEFFPLPIVPVCYVLGVNGQPLEVLSAAEELNVDRFNSFMRKAVSLYHGQMEESRATLPEDIVTTQNSTGEASAQSMDERVQYAKKRLEEKRKADEFKKKEEEKQKEATRRNEGKLMLEMREKNREKELREAANERRKQKESDAAALKQLREQLKQDKEERRAKNAAPGDEGKMEQSQSQGSTSKASVESTRIVNSEQCRIQCKFPDGSTLCRTFASSSPLQVVIDAVAEDGRMKGPFSLVQAYPRQQFSETQKSLLELGLTPSSALLVVSAKEGHSSKALVSAEGGYFNLLLGFLYAPVMAIINFITGLFGGLRPTGSMSASGNQPNNGGDQHTRGAAKKSGTSGGGAQVGRDGKMARLRNDNDDDNEGTWNGNSTQQL